MIVNEFNRYSVSLALKLEECQSENIDVRPMTTFNGFSTQSHYSSIFLEDCTTSEVMIIINGLENNKAGDICPSE